MWMTRKTLTHSKARAGRSAVRPSHQGQEALLLRRIVTEHAGEAAGERRCAMLGDAAHRHAGMLRFDQHRNAAGLEDLVDRGRDLGGEMFLGLQAAGEDVGQPGKLGKSHHPLDGRIGDMRLAIERHHVVLALRGKFDIADQHKIIIAGGLAKGAVQHLGRALMVALVELVERLDNPARRIQETLATGIFADIGQQRLHGHLSFRPRRARLFGSDGNRHELGGIELAGAGLRQLALRRLVGADRFDQCVHVNSVRPVDFLRPECHRQTGRLAAGRLRYSRSCICAEWSLYRTVNAGRQGRLTVPAEDLTAMLNDIYNKKIIELAGNIPLLGRLPAPDASATAHSKLCGSTVKVDLKMDGPVVTDFAHEVKACALGQASSSIMATHVVGSTADELRDLRETVRKMLKENGSPPPADHKWADIALLEPVRDYKARHASTMLTFDAVVDAIGQIEAKAKQPAAAQG